MTISTTTSSVTYQGNGATTVFTFPFVADTSTDIKVYYTDTVGNRSLLSPSLYSLTINPVPVGGLWGIGGSVTYPVIGTPIPVQTFLSIVRDVPNTQDISISNQGAFYPQAVEQGLDVLELQIQQIQNQSDLAIQVPVTDPNPQTILPMPSQRIGQVIGFDSTGENVVMYPVNDVITFNRAIQVPVGDTTASTTLPAAGSRANKVIGFDGTGENVTMLSSGQGFSTATVNHAASPYTVTSANVIFVDASGGNVTINLPSAATVNQIFISRIDNTPANVVGIAPVGGQTIVGGSNYLLKYQYQSNVFLSNGATAWSLESQFRKTSPTLVTNSYQSFINIFDVIDDPLLISNIQNRTFTSYLDSYMAAAIALGGMLFFPSGDYHFQNTITMAAGVEFCGAGQANTVFYTGGTNWGFELLLPNGTQKVEAPKFRDIEFQVATTNGNGIRWNSVTGGFTDDGTSQQYMMRPRIERCSFVLDTATAGIAIQMNKCFDYVVYASQFTNFAYTADFEGSDTGVYTNCRTDGTKTYEIIANSHGTFGSDLIIRDNDFNDPAAANINGGFIDSTYRDIGIYDNHMETDTASVRTNLIRIAGGQSFVTKIHGNRIDSVLAPTNWLNIAGNTNNYLVSVFDNVSAAGPSAMGNVSFTGQTYFNNSGGRCLIRHGGNGSNTGFPMNSDSMGWPTTNVAAYGATVNANTPGISFARSTQSPTCLNGLVVIPYNASAGIYIEISDWANYGLLANQLIGTYTIQLQSAAAAAGLVGSWEVLDGGVFVSSGTVTHAVANQFYQTTIATSHAFTSNAQVRLWNVDGTRASNFYLSVCTFLIG